MKPIVQPTEKQPIVSVIIPTFKRCKLLLAAVQSVLNQTLKSLEIIVVIDGPDAETAAALSQLQDPRLKVIMHRHNQGGAASRSHGIEVARGQWIALLDDDDTWMPTKLERQWAIAQASPHRWPVISCLSEVHYDDHTEVWPRRLLREGEPVSEYLFVRHSLFQGEGLLQTSTLLVPKALHAAIPLSVAPGAKHDDWDWILRIAEHPDTGFEVVAEPLATWNLRTTHNHASGASNPWQSSRQWIRGQRDRVTPLAYASFLLAEVASRAAAARDWRAFVPLLAEAIIRGRPTAKMLLLYGGMWLLSTQQRQRLRMMIQQLRSTIAFQKSPSMLNQL